MLDVTKYSHPSWDMALFIGPNDGRQAALDLLSEDDDPALLIEQQVQMTQEELDALPEFDG